MGSRGTASWAHLAALHAIESAKRFSNDTDTILDREEVFQETTALLRSRATIPVALAHLLERTEVSRSIAMDAYMLLTALESRFLRRE
jgi:hypothetical protein